MRGWRFGGWVVWAGRGSEGAGRGSEGAGKVRSGRKSKDMGGGGWVDCSVRGVLEHPSQIAYAVFFEACFGN